MPSVDKPCGAVGAVTDFADATRAIVEPRAQRDRKLSEKKDEEKMKKKKSRGRRKKEESDVSLDGGRSN